MYGGERGIRTLDRS